MFFFIPPIIIDFFFYLCKKKFEKARKTHFRRYKNSAYCPIYIEGMNTNSPIKWPKGCKLIHLLEHTDNRGSLSFAEAQHEIPFSIERVFWIYDVPEGAERGAHSHNECAEVAVAIQGAFDMTVDDGTTQTTIRLDSPCKGILIPAGVWCRLSNFAPNTVCVVMASHPYNAAGYIHDYDTYREELIETIPYTPSHRSEWDSFVKQSKNGTFLIERGYMDYHAQRFTDCSLLFYKKGKLIAILPANYKKEEQTVYSHGGLTYGGLLLSEKITTVESMQVMACAKEWMRITLGAQRWIYKPIPHIYHRAPAEEDLYALFRQEAVLTARAVSAVIDYSHPIAMQELRKRGIKKACNKGISYKESNDLRAFWKILEETLTERHGRKPVHSVEEMEQLKEAFPDKIHLFVAYSEDEAVAGTVIYETDQVAHAQYIAASGEGRRVQALDGLFAHLIIEVYAGKRYFDFGISTEQGGRYLNEGLAFQKEGFGARAVMYDTYEMIIQEE